MITSFDRIRYRRQDCALNEHLDEEDGPLVFHLACKLGLEGIVPKRRDCGHWCHRGRL
jgi:hypothetical protein